MENLKIGFYTCYIRDYPFNHICEIPEESAKEWIHKLPFIPVLTNKMFVIVAGDHGKYVAIEYNNYHYHLFVQK